MPEKRSSTLMLHCGYVSGSRPPAIHAVSGSVEFVPFRVRRTMISGRQWRYPSLLYVDAATTARTLQDDMHVSLGNLHQSIARSADAAEQGI